MKKYLAENQIESVLADGENYDGARPLHYEWIKRLYDECVKYNVPLTFYGIGNVFVKNGKTYRVPKAYQHIQALRSGFQYPAYEGELKMQTVCGTCQKRDSCGGCRWCGKCRRG